MTDLDASAPVVWPKWCYTDVQVDGNEKTPVGGAPSPPAKSRRKRAAEPVSQLQRETETPDRSPSVSPGSLRSESSPQERRSPATPVSAPAQFLPPPRNYSDFIRSLAAKYNNNNPNEYFASQAGGPVRGLDYSRLGLKPGVGVPPASSQQSQQKGGAAGDRKEPLAGTSPLLAVHPHLAAFSGLPMLDVLSMVRPGLAAAPYLASPPLKRTQDGAPLDLSNIKRPRLEKGFKELFGLKEEESRPAVQPPPPPSSQQHVSVCTQKPCSPEAELVLRWSVEDVVSFVQSVDICAEYAQVFREHRIDGMSLPLLNAEHLTNILKLKLGPALKLRSELSKKIGHCGICMHCNHCHTDNKPKEEPWRRS